jgi:hypothetical protein
MKYSGKYFEDRSLVMIPDQYIEILIFLGIYGRFPKHNVPLKNKFDL